MTVVAQPADPDELSGLLGVLGGMGPLATALFYQRIVEATPGTRDQDHVPVAIWGDPTVPDRSLALIDHDAPSPTPWLLRGGRALESLGASLIAVPCNSASPFLDTVRTALTVPVIDLVDATVGAVAEDATAGSKVAVLCTRGLRRAGTYESALRAAGLLPIQMSWQIDELVHASIVDVKAGRLLDARRSLGAALSDLASASPDVIVAACTELTVLRDDFSDEFPLIDSATVLARTSVHAMRVLERQATSDADELGTSPTSRKATQ